MYELKAPNQKYTAKNNKWDLQVVRASLNRVAKSSIYYYEYYYSI